jgi:hypothetical protein
MILNMKRIDKFIFGIIFGSSFPIFFFLLSVLIWFNFSRDEKIVLYFVSAGISIGLFTDFVILKKLINNRFNLPVWILISFYLFYNIGMYGMFMGFPVFNLIWGVVAGYYFGKKIIYNGIPLGERAPICNRVALFTSTIMLLICISSGMIAMIDKYTGKDLQGMLRLQYEVSKTEIVGIILIGGLALITAQYFLTKTVTIRTIRFNERNNS